MGFFISTINRGHEVEPTSGHEQTLAKFNLGNLPPEGNEWVGAYFNQLWEEAKHHKISYLGMHDRFLDLHDKFRGRRKKNATYPQVSVNYIFKTVQGFCAMLTEKNPVAEFQTEDDVSDDHVKALNKDTEKWWKKNELQRLLYASVQNFQVYGTTIEKFVFDPKTNSDKVILKDPFNCFPAPGYTKCTMKLPYFCDADFLYTWDIRQKFEIPEHIHIPADANEQLFGKERETTRGGKKKISTASNLPSNYAEVGAGDKGHGLENRALVVEIWITDNSVEEVPVIEPQQVAFDDGTPAIDDQGRPVIQPVQVGTRPRSKYPGGIRKVTLVPGLLQSWQKGVVDDVRNPNINWALVEIRKESLIANGLQVPEIDPETGEEVVTAIPIDEEAAEELALKTVSRSWLYSNYPYSATGSLLDTTQWWAFSIIEQLEELCGKAESLLAKYFAFFDMVMFPILLNPLGSGVANSKITNGPGLILNPTPETCQWFRYIQPPIPPQGLLEFLQFILYTIDVISQTPEVTEGRKPKGVSAASAIIALQDKASTLFGPQIRAVDTITEYRGNAHGSFVQNFGTEEKPIKLDKKTVPLVGIDLAGVAFDFIVESGSSAPITKQGRRQLYIELFRLGGMTLKPLLQMLELPNRVIEEVLEEKSVPGAIQLLVDAGLPPEIAQEIYKIVLQNPGMGAQGPNGKPGEGLQTQPTGPNSKNERMQTIYKSMSMTGQ